MLLLNIFILFSQRVLKGFFLTYKIIVRLVVGHLDNVEDCFFLFVADF